MITSNDYRPESATDGCRLFLRNRCAEGNLPPVLFVHGATYGSTMTFDYPMEGGSWMDHMAQAGFDAWCLDLPGYGEADRPAVMNQPASEHEPIVDTADAVLDVDRAVDFIRRQRSTDQVSLIGYSWGSAICGSYAGQFPDKVDRLVLSGALWVDAGSEPRTIAAAPGAYRVVDEESVAKRWSIGLDDAQFADIVSPDTVKKWAADAVRCDPDYSNIGGLRAPTGVLKDFQQCAASGEPWYDPGLIRSPTQVVVGELDRETTPKQGMAVFSRLSGACEKRYTVIGGGTHSLLLENNRHLLYDVVASFLRNDPS